MAYKDLDTFFDPDLKLPIRGKTYTVPAPGAPEAARLRKQVIAEGVPPVEQVFEALKILGAEIDPETEAWSGGVYDEMVADNLPWPMIFHAGRTAIIHYGFTADMGEAHWALAQLGKLVDLEQATEFLGQMTKERRSKLLDRSPKSATESRQLIDELKRELRDTEAPK